MRRGPRSPGALACSVSGRPPGPATRPGEQKRLALLRVLPLILLGVLLLVLTLARLGGAHAPAAARHDVQRVRQDAVLAVAAVDVVPLAVPHVDRVVAGLTVDRVPDQVVRPGQVLAGQRPQVVVAVAAKRRVDALVGEDAVVAAVAVLNIVATATRHPVVAAVAVADVVAAAAVQLVAAVPAGDRVVARTAEDAVVARQVAGVRRVARQVVVAGVADHQIVAPQAADRVVARVPEQGVVVLVAVDLIVPAAAGHPVTTE